MNSSNRITSIDRIKGITVFCCMFFIAASYFPCLGFISRIANNSSNPVRINSCLTLADLENPLYVFLASISLFISFSRRYQRDGKKAYLHFIKRNLNLIGLGAILFSTERFFYRHKTDPVVIQTVLTFAVLGFGFVYLLLLVLPNKWSLKSKAKELVGNIIKYSNLSLGLLGIVLAIYNDIQIFFLGYKYGKIIMYWSILHQIGFTGLLTLPFMKLSTRNKIISWFVLTAAYTTIQLIPGMVETFEIIFLGGFAGVFGWVIFSLGTIIMIGFYTRKETKSFLISLLILVVLSFFAFTYLPCVVRAVTINYVLFSLSVVMVAFCIVNLFDGFEFKFNYFIWWGRNPLLLFLVCIPLLAVLLFWNPPADTPVYIAIPFMTICFVITSSIAYYCYKKEIYIKF